MQSHIQALVKHLFNKDSFEQVSVQELKQFTETYPYAAAGHFLYAKKLYDARSWNYYEQTEQASLYFHNPLWYSWLMEQKYEAPVLVKQEEQLQSPYRAAVQMPKGVSPITSPPASEKEFASLHEFGEKPDATPVEANTETFGDIQAAAEVEEYTEVVTDNTGEQPQPLTGEETGVETIADITAAKEEIEITPEFFAEAAQEQMEPAPEFAAEATQELPPEAVAIAENFHAEETPVSGNGELSQNFDTPGQPSGNEEPAVHIEGDILSFTEGVVGTEHTEENIPVELLAERHHEENVHSASDLTPNQVLDETAQETVAAEPLQEDLTFEHTIDEPIIEKQPVTEEQPETVTETDPQTVTEEQPEQETEQQPSETPAQQQPVTEEQPDKFIEQPAETPAEEQETVTAVDPQPVTEEEPEVAVEQPAETPSEEQPEAEQPGTEQPVTEEPAGPAADLQPELESQFQPVAEHQQTEQQQPEEFPQPRQDQQEEEIQLPGLAALPLVSDFTQANKEQKGAIDTEEPIFESYHTIDYFASQGIKLQQEDYKDRLGKQLKTFSEWLRSMKRIVPTEAAASLDEVTNQSIQRIAEHSVEEKEIVTEAMAEVWLKQGNKNKAISIFEKLSLLNPAKSTYFAGRIEQLKA